jgi:hypothetical protein
VAEDGDLAVRAAEDRLFAAVVSRHGDRLRRCCEQLDSIGLDQQVDHERATRSAADNSGNDSSA